MELDRDGGIEQPVDQPAGRPSVKNSTANLTSGHWLGGVLTVGMMTVLSRILGLIRDIAMARLFGLTPVMDAFTIAFRVPNLARKLFGEGALATAFIPIFARELDSPRRDLAWQLASAVLGWLAIFLSLLVVLVEIGLGLWIWLFASTRETSLLIGLTAILFPYLILVCLASQVGAILNSVGHFKWPATVPVVLNITWLVGIACVSAWFRDAAIQAQVLAAAILISGLLQLAIQVPSLIAIGFRFHFDWQQVRPQVREIIATMLPVVLGLSITQINTFSDSMIAWSFSQPAGQTMSAMPLPGSPRYPLEAGAVSALYYGERMYQFPLGVFGVALSTAIFPLLARHAAAARWEELRQDLSLGMRLVIVIGVPASIALMVLAQPIARCLFERGEFGPAATLRTAQIIAAYGSGVWAYCGLLIIQRACYAIGDRDTPLKVGMLVIAINITLNLSLIWIVGERGLAFSTAACAVLQLGILISTIQRRLGQLDWPPLLTCMGKTLLASGVMAGTGILSVTFCGTQQSLSGKFAGLVIPCSIAGLVFLIAAWYLQIDELWILFRRRSLSSES